LISNERRRRIPIRPEEETVDRADLAVLARRLLTAFSSADPESMRTLHAEDMVSYITNREGGADRRVGREEYFRRIVAIDLRRVQYSVTLTQPPVVVDDRTVLAMVEVKAAKSSRTLHNFAAHLLHVANDQVTEWWMVEAKPAESDRFWSCAKTRNLRVPVCQVQDPPSSCVQVSRVILGL